MADESLLGNNPDVEVAEVNRSGWKIAVTVIFPALVAAGASYLFVQGNGLWSLVLTLFFVNLIALETLLLKSSGSLWLGLLLATLGLVWPFWATVALGSLAITALVILFFLALGVFSGRYQLSNTLKVPLLRTARKTMVGAFTGIVGGLTVLALAGSGALGSSALSMNNVAQYFVDPYVVAPVLEYALHQPYKSGETVRDYVTYLTSSIASSTISVSGTTIGLNSLPTKTESQLVNSAVDTSVAQLNNVVGGQINPDSSIAVDIMEVIKSKLVPFTPLTIIAVLVLWAVVAFLATLLSYVLALIAFVLFELLVLIKFADIQLESRSHEVINLE
ncbi:hypothetical protein M1295_01610 [Patescibacteria group bacterium]|nr:hypothetical protein [Patescibacteria group bacterium]